MTETTSKKSKTTRILVVVIAAALGVISFLVWMNFQQKTEIKEIVEQMEFEKEQLEDEYEELAIQFDGYQTPDIHND
jgi:cell division protein FtsL